MIETWYNQDVKQPVKVRYLDGNVFSQDNKGNRIGVCLYDGETPVNVSGTVSANIIRPDGATVAAVGFSSGNTAYIDLPAAAYSVPGLASVIIKATSGTDITTLCAVVANIYQSTTDSTVDPGTVIPSINALLEAIAAAVASIPADYSDLWTTLAPAFDASVSYSAGQYVTYSQNVYRFKVNHSGTWASADVVNVTIGNELTYVNKFSKSIEDSIYTIGTEGDAVVRLTGQIVPYRYQSGSQISSQSAIRFKLPENVKSVDISMYGLQNMDSYAFLDANDNVLFYKTETTNGNVSYEGLNAWEARYLVCSNNNTYINTISVTATISGVKEYIDEAKKTSGEVYTLLHGTTGDTYYSDFTAATGNYTVIYSISGYDFVEITSYNVSGVNKYTMFDSSNNIIGYFRTAETSEIGTTTTVKVAVPTNASYMYVSTYRAQRPNVLVYGITEPADYGWVNCAGSFVDYMYSGTNISSREHGSKEIAANQYDMFKIVNGTATNNINAFTAFDSNGDIVGYVSLRSQDVTDETYYICPTGTAKVWIAAGRAGTGWSTSASIQIMKRKTTKLMSVLGDSITTFENFVPSSDYNPFYMAGNHDVSSAAETWWGRVLIEKGWKLSTDNAWGGSQVSATSGQYITSAMCNTRCQDLARGGTPDVIVILGGTNDFGHGVPVGTWAGDADLPTEETNFRAAYARMLMKIHASYPLAKVYCCTLINRETDLEPGSMEKKYGQYLTAFNTAIRQIAPMLNCTLIDLESCGLNQYNMETYMADYHPDTGQAVHPNREGMELMAQRILNSLI